MISLGKVFSSLRAFSNNHSLLSKITNNLWKVVNVHGGRCVQFSKLGKTTIAEVLLGGRDCSIDLK